MADFSSAAAVAHANDDLLTGIMDDMVVKADLAFSTAQTALAGIGEIPEYDSFFTDPGQLSMPYAPGRAIVTPTPNPSLDRGELKSISGSLDIGDAPSDADYIDPIDLDPNVPEWDYRPDIAYQDIAPPPDIDRSGQPFKPDVDFTFDDPVMGDVTIPTMDTLVPISLPAAPDLLLPDFDGAYPADTITVPPSVGMVWSEPVYVPELLDEIKPVIIEMLGGKGLPAAVEQALFDRAAEREDDTATKAIVEAIDVYASRGFTMPDGMLVAQVSAIQETALLKKNSLSRDILIKQWDLHYENLKFAVQQGLAYEGVLIGLFSNMAQRTFEAAKYQVEASIAVYNASVSAYNARVAAYSAASVVFKAKLEAELSRLEAYKTEMEGQKIVGDINAQRVQIFTARLQAVKTVAEVYTAQVQAEVAKIDAAKSQLEGFRTEVQAWSEGIQAQKALYDAYATRLQGELGKVQLFKASADAFGAEIEAFSRKEGLKVQKLEAQVKTMSAAIDAYRAQLDAKKAETQQVLDYNRAYFDRFRAEVDKFKVDADIEIAKSRNALDIDNINLQSILGAYNANVKRYEALAGTAIKYADMNRAAAQAAAQVASTVAAGAMSAVHVQSSMSQSGNVSAGFSETVQS